MSPHHRGHALRGSPRDGTNAKLLLGGASADARRVSWIAVKAEIAPGSISRRPAHGARGAGAYRGGTSSSS